MSRRQQFTNLNTTTIQKTLDDITACLSKKAFVPNPQVIKEQQMQEQQMQEQQMAQQEQQQAPQQEQGGAPSIDEATVTIRVTDLLDLVSGGKASIAQLKVQELLDKSEEKKMQRQQEQEMAQQEQAMAEEQGGGLMAPEQGVY